jgi:hypothetical protein
MQTLSLPEQRIKAKPTQASQLIRPRVRILARRKPEMAATATNTAVQVPWTDIALSPIEIPSIPDPATKIQSRMSQNPMHTWESHLSEPLTKAECDGKKLASDSSKHQISSIINAIDVAVVKLKDTDDVASPNSDTRHGAEEDCSRDHS